MIYLRIGEIVDARGWNIQRFADETHLSYPTAYGLYKGRINRIEPGEVFVREPRTKNAIEEG